jgi:2',3'-cyclic-nucleotide 2'-phosphodiesterase (5'-nucleotidase family)
MRTRSVPVALATLSAFAVLFCGCNDKPAAPSTDTAAVKDAGPQARHVSVLVTGHETGHLVAMAPRLIAQWRRDEKWPDAIALSTGDLFAGSSISSHFFGLSTAEVTKALQYRAAALGNHDLDLGIKTLQAFRAASGITFLAANLKDKPNAEEPLKLEPFTIIEREGVKVGVVGLTSEKTIGTTVAGRASGLELVPTESVLPGALEGVKRAGADVVVVIVDDCFNGLAKLFESHADWKADLVVGSRCDGPNEAKVNGASFYSVGDDVSYYVSASVEIAPTGEKIVKVARTALDPKIAEDADLVALRERWQKKLDEELGTVIGFTKTGVKEADPRLRTWVATALKEQTRSDAALINKKGIRAELPKGKITKASIYSMIPFENAVLTVMVKGEVLEKLKANKEAVLVLPPKIDKAKDYQLATTEYLYFGGDALGLEDVAPNPELTGQVWQTPVIEWLEKIGSKEKKPLESLVK